MLLTLLQYFFISQKHSGFPQFESFFFFQITLALLFIIDSCQSEFERENVGNKNHRKRSIAQVFSTNPIFYRVFVNRDYTHDSLPKIFFENSYNYQPPQLGFRPTESTDFFFGTDSEETNDVNDCESSEETESEYSSSEDDDSDEYDENSGSEEETATQETTSNSTGASEVDEGKNETSEHTCELRYLFDSVKNIVIKAFHVKLKISAFLCIACIKRTYHICVHDNLEYLFSISIFPQVSMKLPLKKLSLVPLKK